MKTRHLIAALAATFLVLSQGCQTSESQAVSGDRSSEGTGSVAFRLSQNSFDLLRSEGKSFQIAIGGPGLMWDTTYHAIDTSIHINSIPCGTRYVHVAVMDSEGDAAWSGRDTVEVNPNQYAWAHITLHRAAPKTGGIHIDIDLESGLVDTTPYPPQIDTTFYDSIAYSYGSDTAYTICAGIPWFAPTEFRCARITEKPYPTDTLWTDSTLYRDGFQPECRIRIFENEARMSCTRFIYQIPTDTVWKDTTVHTASLDSQTWCRGPIWADDPHTYCSTGRYLSFAQDSSFLREMEQWYGTRNLCEDIQWIEGRPYATVRACNKKP